MNQLVSKKLHLISLLIKETNADALNKVGEILLASAPDVSVARFENFSNKLSVDELNEFETNIEEGCGK